MEKREIILPEKQYEKAPSEEIQIVINLDEQQKLLTNDDRDIIVDVNEVFNRERNNCTRYKIYGKIRMIYRNMYVGTSNYDYLTDKLYLLGDGTENKTEGFLPYNEFAFLRNDICREEVTERKVADMSSFDGFNVSITGSSKSSQHKLITEINSTKFNWNIYLSYVFDQNSDYPMKYTLSGNTTPLSFVSGDGIPFRVEDVGKSYKLTSPVDHGMSEGEFIVIDGFPYYINSIGDEVYDSQNYVINIVKSQIPSGTTTFSKTLINGKRCLDNNNISGTTCQYYIHKHVIASTVDNYIIDKTGFESPIWEDERKILFETNTGENDVVVERNRMESLLYDFNSFFVLSGITNNLGYTPTEAYVTVVFRNSNGYFKYPPKVGYKFNFHNQWIDRHFDGSTSNDTSLRCTTFDKDGITFCEGSPLTVGDELIGAFVEYDPFNMKERIISESYHKIICDPSVFNHGQTGNTPTFSGATVTNPFGLFYQDHYRVKLRELSPYIETSNSPDMDNLPDNARYNSDEKIWKWRDLYDHGYIDDQGCGVNNPFMNDTHYVRNDINFYLRNEELYTNKSDGIFDFNSIIDKKKNNSKDNINC